MAISAYVLKIVEKDPFLRLEIRAKEDFNRLQLFSTNKQYVPGGHSITRHTGGWLEGLNQKPQNIYPKIAIFKKC